MGSWGTALYSDDLAADLRDELSDLIGQGLSADEAIARLEEEYAEKLDDVDEAPVFRIAVAHIAWKLGRPVERATIQALHVIESGGDLHRWESPPDRRKRANVLERVGADLRSPPPPAKRVRQPVVADNRWDVGEIVAYRLTSGNHALFRVIGHHVDRGGRHAVCEPLDWSGPEIPGADAIATFPVRPRGDGEGQSQFMLGEPRRRQDVERITPTGVVSTPMQRPDRYTVFVFPYVDMLLRDNYGLQ